jgi:hypothetical protein
MVNQALGSAATPRASTPWGLFTRIGAALGLAAGLALVALALRSDAPGPMLRLVGTPLIYVAGLLNFLPLPMGFIYPGAALAQWVLVGWLLGRLADHRRSRLAQP